MLASVGLLATRSGRRWEARARGAVKRFAGTGDGGRSKVRFASIERPCRVWEKLGKKLGGRGGNQKFSKEVPDRSV